MSVFRKRRPTATPQTGDYEDFLKTLTTYTVPVLRLCHFAFEQKRNPDFPCRDYLGHLHRDASMLQEILDLHGAQTNTMWFPFRESIAAAKNFAAVTYDVLHVRQAIHRYQLLASQEDFAGTTDAVLSSLRDVVFSVAATIIDQTRLCGIHPEEVVAEFEPCIAAPLAFRLTTDREVRHVDRIGEQVVYLATQFLNLSEDSDVQEVLDERDEDECQSCIPYPLSEERMRTVKARFHNLQSLYDTYIFESDLEQQNEQLRYLRGHISIIYHLLSIGTDLVHYYIRHMSALRRETYREMRFPMEPERLREQIFDYPLRYAREYMDSAVQLCRSMIQAYSEQAEITVPIPNYRGFHVRPSTLIARIVLHYGSKVSMHMDDQIYDAAAPMDLFRANEVINRIKRRRIADMLSKLPDLQRPISNDREELVRELQLIFVRLMNAGQIIMYDTDLSFNEIEVDQDTTMADLVARAVRHFMSIAKVDVQSDITVRFEGDSRALKDLEILADHGYGEDRMGNNVVLPEELSYLARR